MLGGVEAGGLGKAERIELEPSLRQGRDDGKMTYWTAAVQREPT